MIRTPRLLLRPAVDGDLAQLHAVFSDPRAMRYWSRPPHEDLEPTQRMLDGLRHGPTPDSFDLVIEHQGRCIGKAGVWAKPEIGYILHPDYWGRGLMREALGALLPRLFDHFDDLDSLTAEIDPRNLASAHLLGAFGFEQTGFAEKNFLYGGKEWCDSAYFALPRHALKRDQPTP